MRQSEQVWVGMTDQPLVEGRDGKMMEIHTHNGQCD